MAGNLLGGRYRLVEKLGSGGMAVVWRGYDEVLGRQVAIKVPAPGLAADAAFRQRLRAEAQAAARLSHPHLTTVHDYGPSYVVMELVEGTTLSSVLGDGQTLPWQQAAAICAEVAMALAAAHERGIVHRDVTANNVMLTSSGVKVLDFGISALAGEPEPEDPGQMLGTPAFVAPERLRQADVTPAVDVYAVGILLYRCLRGALPWAAGDTEELFTAHLWLTPTELPDDPDLPDELRQLCYECLAKEPADRPDSAELATRLSTLAGSAVVSVLPATSAAREETKTNVLAWQGTQAERPKSKRRTALVAIAGTAAVLAASGAAMSSADRPRPQWHEPVAAAEPPPAACHVTFQVTRDDGANFAANVTVQSTETGPASQLRFPWPGDQHMTQAAAAHWDQSGREVVVQPNPGQQQIELSGTYSALNALPASFAWNGSSCTSTLVGAPAVVLVAEESDDSGKGKGKGKGRGDGHDDDD